MELGNSRVKTAEAEAETPSRVQPAKRAPLTNGVLKRHAPLHHHHPVVVTYRECLKNHAASVGGHAVDGCGEFMLSPTSNHAEPTTLKCAACGCHRNFHRREPDEPPLLPPPPSSAPALGYQSHHRHHPPPPPRGNGGSSPNNSPSPPPISSSYYPSAPHMLLALSHGLSGPPPETNIPVSTATNAASTPMFNSSKRKRFRTKFTQSQKDKMLEFAERVGWKMQKTDDSVINEFCNEIGVDRGVLRVWMHNNKNTAGKKDQPLPPHLSSNATGISTPPPATTNGNSMDYGDTGAAAYRAPHEGQSDIKPNVRGQETGELHDHDNTNARALGTHVTSV